MMQLLRMLGILFGMLMTAGFGLCGAYGVFAAGHIALAGFDPFGFAVFLGCGLAGIGIGLACARTVWLSRPRRGAGAGPAE